VLQAGDAFQVTSYINLQNVNAEKREAFITAAISLRQENGVRRAMRDEQSFVVMKRVKDLTQAKAIKETSEQLDNLRATFELLLR